MRKFLKRLRKRKKMNNKDKKYNKSDINTIVISLYLAIPMLTTMISAFIHLNNCAILLIGLLLITFIIYNAKKIIITKEFILINILVTINFLLSFILVEDYTYTIQYLLSYLVYGMCGMFFIQYKVEYKNVFKSINIIFILFTIVLIYKYIPLAKSSNNLDFTMGLSYALMIGLSGTLMNLKYDKSRFIKIIDISCVIINIYYLIFINNNRGSIIALLFFMGLWLLGKIKNRRKRIIVAALGLLIIVISVNGILNYLQSVHTNINWINRIQRQLKNNNILTGRNELYSDALQYIRANPLIGIGIGKFENNHSGLYTHNIFLQLACENGTIWAIVVGTYIISCIYRNIINTNNSEENMFLIFLLVQFIPRLLISSVHWSNAYIWMYLYMYMSKTKKKEQIEQNGEYINENK